MGVFRKGSGGVGGSGTLSSYYSAVNSYFIWSNSGHSSSRVPGESRGSVRSCSSGGWIDGNRSCGGRSIDSNWSRNCSAFHVITVSNFIVNSFNSIACRQGLCCIGIIRYPGSTAERSFTGDNHFGWGAGYSRCFYRNSLVVGVGGAAGRSVLKGNAVDWNRSRNSKYSIRFIRSSCPCVGSGNNFYQGVGSWVISHSPSIWASVWFISYQRIRGSLIGWIGKGNVSNRVPLIGSIPGNVLRG